MKKVMIAKDVGVKNIADFKQELLHALNADNEILLHFKNVRRIDLAVVQVIMAAFKEAKKRKKKIVLRGLASEIIKKQLYICGLLKNPVS
jgi:anti-anti-sigma factor